MTKPMDLKEFLKDRMTRRFNDATYKITEGELKGFEITLKPIPYATFSALREEALDNKDDAESEYTMLAKVVKESLQDLDFNSTDWLKELGAVEPVEGVKKVFTFAEVANIAHLVSEISGFDSEFEASKEIVKNS